MERGVQPGVAWDGDRDDGIASASGEMEGGGASAGEAESEADALAEAEVKASAFDARADVGAVVFAEFDVLNVGCEEGADIEGLWHRAQLSRGLFDGRRGCHRAGR